MKHFWRWEWHQNSGIVAPGWAIDGVWAVTWLALLATLWNLRWAPLLIGLVFGSEYVAAHEVLVMISAATTASVLVFAVDPALYSLGRPSRSLITALVSAAVFTLVLVLRTGADGLSGAGWAYLAASAITVALQCFWFYHHIRGRASSG